MSFSRSESTPCTLERNLVDRRRGSILVVGDLVAPGRGVAVVVIPGDVALQSLSAPVSAGSSIAIRQPVVVPAAQDIDALAALLNESMRTTLLCGRGCAGVASDRSQAWFVDS